MACGLYDRTAPLLDGTVRAEGIDLNFVPMQPGELFRRQGRHAEFDVAEFSLSTYSILRARGDERMIAIPVFPSRKFRHSHIFVNRDLVRAPHDLIGQRVGASEYQQTAGVWIRGILRDEYGVESQRVTWVLGGLNEPKTEDRIPITLPSDLDVVRLPPDRWLDDLLRKGEIGAVVAAQIPSSMRERDAAVERLFPDYESVERAYFKKTGIFPIMHLVVVKRKLYEAHPWIARSLMKAFEGAKAEGRARLRFPGTLHVSLPWLDRHLEDLGELEEERDLFEYGVSGNEKTLKTFLAYANEQGLLDRPLAVEELFAPEVM